MKKIILSENQLNLLYHGSPKYFKKFDPNFIGTGFNVSRLGWGFYFTVKSSNVYPYKELNKILKITLNDEFYIIRNNPRNQNKKSEFHLKNNTHKKIAGEIRRYIVAYFNEIQ